MTNGCGTHVKSWLNRAERRGRAESGKARVEDGEVVLGEVVVDGELEDGGRLCLRREAVAVVNDDAGNPFESWDCAASRNGVGLRAPRVALADEVNFDDEVVSQRSVGKPVEVNAVGTIALFCNGGADEGDGAERDIASARFGWWKRDQ